MLVHENNEAKNAYMQLNNPKIEKEAVLSWQPNTQL